jgi:TonB family protein
MAKNLQQDVPPPPPPPPPPGETSKPSEPIVKKSADNMTLMFNAIRNEKNVSDTLMIIIGRDGRVFLKLGNGRDTILHFRPKILENMGSRYNITFTPMELRIFEVYDIPFGVTIRDMKPFLATFLRSNNDYERQKFEKGIPCDVADNQLYCWLLYATQVTGSINIHIDAKEGPNSAIEKAKHVLDKLSEGYLNINNSVEVIEQKQEGVQEKEEQQVFVIVEEMPEFPGGELALRNYIAKAIVYPVVAKGKGSQGKVFVTFVVNNDGSVSNAKIARGVDTSLDAEALRVVSTLPKWKPGKQRGVPVRVSYTVPVSFKLQ